MLHCIIAPAFVLGLATLALLGAGRCRFNASPVSPWAHKLCFWLMLILALPLILSIGLAMFPLYGTTGQRFLLNLHQYSALIFAMLVIWHAYLLTASRKS